MSEMRVDSITNSAGTGAPNFPHGVTGANVSQSSPGLVASAGQLLGTNTNDDALSGNVGEYLEHNVSTFAASPGTVYNVCTLTLTPGEWDTNFNAIFSGTASSTTIMKTAINSTSVTFPSNDNLIGQSNIGPNGVSAQSLAATPRQFKVAASTTLAIYGIAAISYTGSGAFLSGILRARRVR